MESERYSFQCEHTLTECTKVNHKSLKNAICMLLEMRQDVWYDSDASD